ncbi:DUF2993 domain-containing protein [[Mycobacterium] wendilense]|uniref:DUF2993 domain-containing protein n=1 Tax=[Mycobacterium] wendilense TaxID=3064284 RepID=A0ABN9P524_9MYCO|nr:DUF2993 domain-containing protein [Mycolicibacterium sp. MU0050]CAJ1585648.1 DUF2993 domain-containing protein [Mycolicibacterium sp. MU0050]
MTNPPHGDDPMWARPTPEPTAATERFNSAPGAEARPTERIERPHADPATQHIPRADTPPPPAGNTPPPPPAKESPVRRFLSDPLSITLVLVIVAALGIAGVLAGELYARNRANTIVAQVTSCVVEDEATASFGVTPPFLWQHARKKYTNISIETAGNQVRDAKGMTVNIDIEDVQLAETANSGGTIGSLVATITWTTEGIKQTVQDAIPLFGGIVSDVQTNPNDGTIELRGGLGSITAKPRIDEEGLALDVLSVSGLGFTLPRETVQPVLDAFTSQLTKGYPMGIHAESVDVTDSGVIAVFATTNATIPPANEDPCFAGL